MPEPTQFGLTGLAVMGANLARNVAHHGFSITVHNRTQQKTDDFIKDHGSEGQIVGSKSLEEFVQSIAKPRPILMMVKAGTPVDDVIDQLEPLLREGDLLIDGGNSLFTDTQRRVQRARRRRYPFPRHRRFRRRGRRAERPIDHARRHEGRVQDHRADFHQDRRAGGRRTVLPLHGAGRRGPLREDGSQRH